MAEYQNPAGLATSELKTRCNGARSIDPDEVETSGSTFMDVKGGMPIVDLPPPMPSPHSSSHQEMHKSISRQENPPSSSDPKFLEESSQFIKSPISEQGPQFRSALSYTEVRDYAYPEFHPLHYGAPVESDSESRPLSEEYEGDRGEEYPDSYMRDGGPPWKEDPDLASPVIISHSVGDRISREYEFSVASVDEIHGRAVALFDFTPENENEAPLKEGQIIWVSYRHGQGWLVAEDPSTGETGLVPEEYVQMLTSGHGYSSSQSSAGTESSTNDAQRQFENLNEHYAMSQTQQLLSVSDDYNPMVGTFHEDHNSQNLEKLSETNSEGWVDESSTSEEDETLTGARFSKTSKVSNTKQVDELVDTLKKTNLK